MDKFPISPSSMSDRKGALFLLAARNKSDLKLAEFLEDDSSLVVYTDQQGNSALHWLLAKGCFCEKCTKKALLCLRILLENGSDPNGENLRGKMALHLVVDNQVPMALVKELVRYGAKISGSDGIIYPDLAKKMVVNYPEALVATFDSGVKFQNDGLSEHIQVDWRYLTYSRVMFDVKESANHMGSSRNKQQWQETKFLYDVVRLANSDTIRLVLNHPLVHTFLNLKSPVYVRSFGLVHFLFFVLGFCLYYGFIWIMYFKLCPWGVDTSELGETSRAFVNKLNNSSSSTHDSSKAKEERCTFVQKDFVVVVTLAYLTLGTVILGPLYLEWRKLINFGLREYLKLWQTWITLLTVALVITTLWAALRLERSTVLSWEYPWSAVAIVVGSISVMIQLQLIPPVALHLEMLFKVTTQVGLAALCILPLFFGFYASFRFVVTEKPNKIGVFKLLTMVISDVDYDDLFDTDRGTVYEIITYALFVSFITIMVIVVVNFLIGIAVSDVQKLQEDAATKNLSNLISSLYLMECVLGQTGRHTLLNNKAGKGDFETSESKYIYKVYRDCEDEGWGRTSTSSKRMIPRALEFKLLQVARRSCAKREWDLKEMNWMF